MHIGVGARRLRSRPLALLFGSDLRSLTNILLLLGKLLTLVKPVLRTRRRPVFMFKLHCVGLLLPPCVVVRCVGRLHPRLAGGREGSEAWVSRRIARGRSYVCMQRRNILRAGCGQVSRGSRTRKRGRCVTAFPYSLRWLRRRRSRLRPCGAISRRRCATCGSCRRRRVRCNL